MKKISLGVSALTLSPFINACQQKEIALSQFSDTEIDVEMRLSAIEDTLQIIPGSKTYVWRYQGELIRGPENTIQIFPGAYLGPIIHLQKGQNVRVRFENKIPEPSIIHWHGLHVPASADGHPRLVIEENEEYIYDFTVMDRAGTYWFHPHPHGRTGPQVYQGLAGLILIHDETESALGLPSGANDLPIVIQDRTFSTDNQLVYTGSRMDQMMGFFGDTLLINGVAPQPISVSNRSYRLRLLNGSNARIYKLAWADNTPLTIIATDGGLLETPIQKDYLTLAPAQRIELWVDFGKHAIGDTLELVNKANSTPAGGDEYAVAVFSIEKEASTSSLLPDRLSSLKVNVPENAVNTINPRLFSLQMGMGMTWNINGRTFEMNDVASDEKVRLGDLEVWQFSNSGTGGMGMELPHPMHIHGLQFQIIERKIDPQRKRAWQSVGDGFVDVGWHDTVLVMPGEQVKVLVKFEDFEGLYLYHCHNLEHEDMGMMRNYQVIA